jgi:uncharacterized repeat protein (TIGR03803 family)
MTVGVAPSFLPSFARLGGICRLWAAAMVTVLLALPTRSMGGPSTLYTFSAAHSAITSAPTNSDGLAPASKLLLASDGNLYGTTLHGGVYGAGSIFRLTPGGSFTNLYSFPAATNNSGGIADALEPNDLMQGANGNFYGTTRRGGSNFNGTIFEISPAGSFTNLHTFAALTTNSSYGVTGAEGAMPVGALVLGNDQNFYGSTGYGGSNNTGTIFRLTPTGLFSNLYSFGAIAAGLTTTNGAVPNALTLGVDGALYGTTQQGGHFGAGTFFKFSTAGVLTQLYSFNGASPENNPLTPHSTLVQASNGVFYGTSAFGGTQGGGSIFAITNNGGVSILYSFPQLNAGSGASLTLGSDGNFYGTIAANGLGSNGAIFRITLGGNFGAYDFAPLNTNLDNLDGANPSAALTADSTGNLYGTCAAGGSNGSGVIFKFYGPDFSPPFFVTSTNPPPALTNVLVGASVTLSYQGQGSEPLTFQWLRNGTNLEDGGDIVGSLSNTIIISPVFPGDAGQYTLQISNTWSAVTSPATILTVTPPGVSILSPAANSSTNSLVFAGTASSSPFTNVSASAVKLTSVVYSILNNSTGTTITGTNPVTAGSNGVYNWTFQATPPPGTNVLSVSSRDVAGNVSPVASETFFYAVSSPLTILTTGSGTGTFSITNHTLLDIGRSYTETARPVSSIFSNWLSLGLVSYSPALTFIMQSNLVLTANFLSRQLPSVSISAPASGARITSPVFKGTAAATALLAGVNSNNIRLTNVVYWLTNVASSATTTGTAVLTQGAGGISNWSFTATPLGGTNILAVQCMDASGDLSPIVFQNFFYKVPATFVLSKTGNGDGTFTATTAVSGDTLPTNGVLLNVGESYTITAKPDSSSTFVEWITTSGGSASNTLSFVMQPGFTATAKFQTIPPVIAISSPTANQRTAAPTFTGTASGHYRITNVTYSLANNFTGSVQSGWANLTSGSGTVSNWSFTLVPAPGTNTLTVQCKDIEGGISSAVSRTFFYEVTSVLTVTNAGKGHGTFSLLNAGTKSSPTNGVLLDLGQTYTLTATPDSSSLFSNWVGSVSPALDAATPSLSFVMTSNLVLTATFVPNFFGAVAGTYNGLFFPPGAIAAENSGMLQNLVLSSSGAFSAKILTDGTNYHVATNFNAAAAVSFAAGPLQFALNLDTYIPEITGTVSSSTGMASLIAKLASNTLPSGEYTMLFAPSATNATTSPPGDGYALVTNAAGTVTLTGALADGTSYSQTVPVSRSADLPIYLSLYVNPTNTSPGLLIGWINLTNHEPFALFNSLTWIKKATVSPGIYTNGFTNTLSVQISPWVSPAKNLSAISLTNGQLNLSNSSFNLDYTNITVSSNLLAAAGISTNLLTGSISGKNGLLTLTFSAGRSTSTAFGVFLQNSTNAGGYFLTSTNAGAFNLLP